MGALEFIISMKDRATSTLEKIGREFTQVKTNAEKLTTTIGHLETHGQNLRIARDSATSISELRRLNRELDQTERKVEKLQNIGKGGGLKNLINEVPGGALLTNPIAIAAAGIGLVAKVGMDAEKTNVAFEVLLGNQQKAASLVKQIRDYGAKTSYESPDLENNAKMLLNFGVASEKIMPTLKNIGDIAMGDKEHMNGLTLAFAQVSSAGKMQGQDLLQMINAGFNPLQEISVMTGKSMGQLRKEMEKGEISAEMVAKAFQHATGPGGRFHDMALKMSQTFGGVLSTAIDNTKETLLTLWGVIEPVLTPALKGVMIVLGWLNIGLKWFIGNLKEGNPIIWGIVAAIGAYAVVANGVAIAMGIASLATGVWTGMQWLLNAALSANPIGLVVAAIGLIVVSIGLAYQKLGWFRGAIYASWEAIKGFASLIKDYVVDRIKGLISGLGGIAKALMQVFSGDFKNAWETAKQAGSDLIGVDAAKNAAKHAKSIGEKMGDAYNQGEREVYNKALADRITNRYKNSGKAGKIAETGISETKTLTTTNSNTDDKNNNKAASNSVASGGTRNTQITINLGKMVENIVFQGGIKENANELERQVEETLLRVLYAAQSAS